MKGILTLHKMVVIAFLLAVCSAVPATASAADAVNRNQEGDHYYMPDLVLRYAYVEGCSMGIGESSIKDDGIYHHGSKNIGYYDSRTGILHITYDGSHEGASYVSGTYSIVDGTLLFKPYGGGDPVAQALKDDWGKKFTYSDILTRLSSLSSDEYAYVNDYASQCQTQSRVYSEYEMMQHTSDAVDAFLSNAIENGVRKPLKSAMESTIKGIQAFWDKYGLYIGLVAVYVFLMNGIALFLDNRYFLGAVAGWYSLMLRRYENHRKGYVPKFRYMSFDEYATSKWNRYRGHRMTWKSGGLSGGRNRYRSGRRYRRSYRWRSSW